MRTHRFLGLPGPRHLVSVLMLFGTVVALVVLTAAYAPGNSTAAPASPGPAPASPSPTSTVFPLPTTGRPDNPTSPTTGRPDNAPDWAFNYGWGTLHATLLDGQPCVYVNTGKSREFLWPLGYKIAFNPVRLLNAQGHVIAHEGDHLLYSGGKEEGAPVPPGNPCYSPGATTFSIGWAGPVSPGYPCYPVGTAYCLYIGSTDQSPDDSRLGKLPTS